MIWFFFGIVIGVLIGIQAGYWAKEALERLRTLLEEVKKKPEPEQHATVTLGAYRPPQEGYQSSQIISPKTPQQMEYEKQLQVRRENGLTE